MKNKTAKSLMTVHTGNLINNINIEDLKLCLLEYNFVL